MLRFMEEAAEAAAGVCRGAADTSRIEGRAHLYRQRIRHETRERVVADERGGVRVEVRATLRGLVVTRRVAAGGVGGLSEVMPARRLGDDLGRSLLEKRQEAAQLDGQFPLILAAGGCSAFLHEIGHLLEADHASASESGFALGRRIGPRTVSILDDPRVCAGRGSYRFDDEGCQAKATLLLDEGVIANRLKMESSVSGLELAGGNARRGSYRDLPLPRMACTYLIPGQDDPDAIVHDTARGVYVRSLRAGFVDPWTCEVTLGIDEGFLVEAGHLTRPIAESFIVARADDLIASIDAVGSDLRFDHGAGDCVKRDQRVPVMVGLPTIRTGLTRVLTP